MATEFIVQVEDRPGALAALTEILARNAINILAIHASSCIGEGVVQFVPDNPDATTEALRHAGFDYVTQTVLLVTMVDEPGALARLSRALADAGVNINAVYISVSGQLVLDVDDRAKAQQIALGFGAG